MHKVKLFELKQGSISLAKDEVLLIPEFQFIYKRDKGSPGDSEGRKKLRAFKEFSYIYYIADIDSPCNAQGMKGREAHEFAVRNSGLETKYKPDDHIKGAIKKYKELTVDINRELITTLLGIFRNTLLRVKKIDESLNEFLDGPVSVSDTEQVVKLQKELFQISTELPGQIERLNTALEQVKLMETKGELMKGGDEIPESAMPDTSIS